jgi:BioD-like phosphotransacetylase family protein
MIMTALGCFRDSEEKKLKVCGLILSGGIVPAQPIMDLLGKAQIPVLLAKTDTYHVATTIYDLTVKIRPSDKNKVQAVVELIKKHVDLDKVLKGM